MGDVIERSQVDDALALGEWAAAGRLLAWEEAHGVGAMSSVTGLTLASISAEHLHQVRQAYLRSPGARYARAPWSRRVRDLVARIGASGFARVPGVVSGRRLDRIRTAIDAGLAVKEPVDFHHYDQKEYWRDEQQSWVFNDALELAPELARVCRSRWLNRTADHYLGKRAHIKRVYGMRYLPKEQPESHQFGWHHDMEDRYLKVMLLLTDVSELDQYMSYVLGTHQRWHSYEMFFRNTLSWDLIERDPNDAEMVKTVGRAGDMFLFDPNGMHRGVRSLGATRDAIFIEFTADGNLGNVWGSELGIEQPDFFGTTPKDPLRHFHDLSPKWERRKTTPRTHTTWVESLPDPAMWLRHTDARR